MFDNVNVMRTITSQMLCFPAYGRISRHVSVKLHRLKLATLCFLRIMQLAEIKSGRRPRHRCSKDIHASTLTCVITFAARLTDPAAALSSEGLEVCCFVALMPKALMLFRPTHVQFLRRDPDTKPCQPFQQSIYLLWSPPIDQPSHMTAFISI